MGFFAIFHKKSKNDLFLRLKLDIDNKKVINYNELVSRNAAEGRGKK
jgi:hypothetical protein